MYNFVRIGFLPCTSCFLVICFCSAYVIRLFGRTSRFLASHADVLRLVTRSSPHGEERVTSLRTFAWTALKATRFLDHALDNIFHSHDHTGDSLS